MAPGVSAVQLGHGEKLHGQYVELEPEGVVERHDHPHEQITHVTGGKIVMTIGEEEHTLAAGDTVVIPGDVPHEAINETDGVASLIDVFSPPREDLLE